MKFNIDSMHVEMSVRELCFFGEASGDLGAVSSTDLFSSMEVGREVHKAIQSSRGAEYYPEVTLRNTSLYDGIYYCVSGRADGIEKKGELFTVEEIKTVKTQYPVAFNKPIHFSQLYCYAFFLAVAKDLKEVACKLTYFNLEDGEISENVEVKTADELREHYIGLIKKVSHDGKREFERAVDRLPKMKDARFPYPFVRESQNELIRECYYDLKSGSRLFAQAPTGIGKTISTVYPSVRYMGHASIDKIFYLTAKGSTVREAIGALKRMNSVGTPVISMRISSREQMCLLDRAFIRQSRSSLRKLCNPTDCKFAKGYYDRLAPAIDEILASGLCFEKNDIIEVAKKYEICPYEFSLDLSYRCDLIICDYNYVFSPSVYLKRYFGAEGAGGKYVFLVDEAHNLADRARDMYSAVLSLDDILALKNEIESDTDPERDMGENARTVLIKALNNAENAFSELSTLCRENSVRGEDGRFRGYSISRSPIDRTNEQFVQLFEFLNKWIKKNKLDPICAYAEELSDKLFSLKTVLDYYDEKFLTFIQQNGDNVEYKILCLDPSNVLESRLEKAESSVLFSATLTPQEYFADTLGGGYDAVCASFASPFPRENLCVAALTTVSTRYDDRENSYRRISSAIAGTVSAKAGNYIVYFPSYDYMEKVSDIFKSKYPKVEVAIQKRKMTASEREEFLNFFDNKKTRLRVGFCVLGGLFSEGVDLPGDRLIGAVIVGVGIPGLSDELNIIRDYYEEKCGEGYDYVYTYPGMNSVLQAAGRVIRTGDDRGIVVLIDDRYAEPKYRALFPEHWKGIKFATDAQNLAEIARKFWEITEK